MKQVTDKKRYMDHTKLIWHMDRVLKHYKNGERVAPIHIDVGLTKKCQLKCKYCYAFFQNPSDAVISRKGVLENLVASAAKIGVKSLGLIGDGEPTLNPTCWEAMQLGKKLGLDLSISTNGILITDNYKRASILENCVWMRFNVSAFSVHKYFEIHGRDVRNLVFENISNLVKYKQEHNLNCEIGLQMVFNPILMKDEVIPLSQFAVDVGVDYFVIKQCSLPDDGESGIAVFDVNTYDTQEIVDILKTAEKMSTERTDIVPKWNLIQLKGVKNYSNCVGVQLLPEVSGDGGVYPCAVFFGGNKPEFCYGNLNENSLEEIVFSDKYWRIVEFLNTKFNPSTDCKGCCRQDMTNEFIWEFLHPPKGINFI